MVISAQKEKPCQVCWEDDSSRVQAELQWMTGVRDSGTQLGDCCTCPGKEKKARTETNMGMEEEHADSRGRRIHSRR